MVCAWGDFILGFVEILLQIVSVPLVESDFIAQFSRLVQSKMNLLTRLKVLLLNSRPQMHFFHLAELLKILPVEVLQTFVFADVLSEKMPRFLDDFLLQLDW